MLAIGLVPYRDHVDSCLGREDARIELSFGLMGEAIAHSEGKFAEYRHDSLQILSLQVRRTESVAAQRTRNRTMSSDWTRLGAVSCLAQEV
jgi:hypothetical protein